MMIDSEYLPKSPNTYLDINHVLLTGDPWLLAVTLGSINLVTQSISEMLVPFTFLPQAASPTEDKDQSHIQVSSELLWNLVMLSWQPPCKSNGFCQPFQEIQDLEVKKEKQIFVSTSGAKDSLWS